MKQAATVLRGRGAVPGVAIGKIKLTAVDLETYLKKYIAAEPALEQEKLEQALEQAAADLAAIVAQARAAGEEKQAEIMTAHELMVADPELKNSITVKITSGMPAPSAVLAASDDFAAMLAALDNEYMQERAADVRDIGRRLARLLLGIKNLETGSEPLILCADEIEPSAIAALPPEKVLGVVMGQGGLTSHAVIIAKARGLATVVGLGQQLSMLTDGLEVVVDAEQGEVVVVETATAATVRTYRAREAAGRKQRQHDLATAALLAETKDGVRIQLAANVGVPEDMAAALPFGCEGVGLFRTEFLFMGHEDVPDEEEQLQAYKTVVEQCGEHLCVIRTMDIGGDKPLPYLNIPPENNPFLGWRAIRISLVRTDLLLTQLRAILRASAFGKVAIMLPMIISIAEIHQARKLLQQAMTELEQEGRAFDRNIQFGIMVETPAAAVTAQLLAKECDFFSIGANDLVQYTLAVDRVNPQVSNLYDPYHPAVLLLVAGTIAAARKAGIWVGMCGEMASDPLAAALLVGMGIQELSMSAPSIPRVKEVIRRLDMVSLQNLAAKALQLADGKSVQAMLSKELG